MRLASLDDMIGGWFVGDFEPSLFRSPEVEVGIKRYSAGDYEAPHVHRVATELTAIISGQAELAGRPMGEGDVAILEPGEVADFRALTAVVLVAVKLPSVTDDKFEA